MTQANSSTNPQPFDAMTFSKGLSLRPVLDALSRGQVVRSLVGGIVRVLAALAFVAGFLGLAWSTIQLFRYSDLSFGQGISALFILLWGWIFLAAACHVAYLRGNDILRLNDSQFTVMSVCALLLRLLGEVDMIFYLIAGILMFFTIWLIGGGPATWFLHSMIPLPMDTSMSGGFVGALIALVLLWITGVVTLLICYLLAELISVLSNIADNTRGMRAAAESHP